MAEVIISPQKIRKRFKKINFDSRFSIVESARRGIDVNMFFLFAKTIEISEKELASLLNLTYRTLK